VDLRLRELPPVVTVCTAIRKIVRVTQQTARRVKINARHEGLLKNKEMSEKSWNRKARHNVQSLVHQRSASGLGGNDISSDVTKVVRGQYKSSNRIIIYLLAPATLEGVRFRLLVGRAERQEQIVFLNLRISRFAFLRGHFL